MTVAERNGVGLVVAGGTGAPVRVVAPAVPGTTAAKWVRRRRESDLGACARLLRVVYYEGHCPPEAFAAPRAWLDGGDLLGAWVSVRLGEILGHVSLSRVGTDGRSVVRWQELTGHEPSRLALVSRLYVRPRFRRRGVGTALVDAAAAAGRARGLIPVLELDNPGGDATGLCERLGWRLLAVDLRRNGRDLVPVHRYAAPNGHPTALGQSLST